jgi:pilus assembly protein CpaB
MRKSNLIILVLALVMGAVAAMMARSWMIAHTAQQGGAATIVVANAPLAFGTVLTSDNLVEIPWASAALPEGAFATKADLLKDGRRVVLNAIERSEMILKSKITGPGQRASLSTLLEEGQRAVTVRVDDVRGVAGFILPGDRVDVMLLRSEAKQGETENTADVLLENVKVLAIDQLVNERQDQPAVATVAKAVTLQVSPEQAQKILLAGNIGKLSLVLRQAGESRLAQTGRISDGDLGFAKREQPKTKPPALTPVDKGVLPAIAQALKLDTVKVTIFHGTDEKKYDVIQEREDWEREAKQ